MIQREGSHWTQMETSAFPDNGRFYCSGCCGQHLALDTCNQKLRGKWEGCTNWVQCFQRECRVSMDTLLVHFLRLSHLISSWLTTVNNAKSHFILILCALYMSLGTIHNIILGVKGTRFDFVQPVFEYNQRLYSLGGLAGNDRGFEHSICASRGHATIKRHWANM